MVGQLHLDTHTDILPLLLGRTHVKFLKRRLSQVISLCFRSSGFYCISITVVVVLVVVVVVRNNMVQIRIIIMLNGKLPPRNRKCPKRMLLLSLLLEKLW